MNTMYKVLTQHRNYSPARFIAPIPIEAQSPEAAARERLAMLANSSARDVAALLVTRGDSAWVFPVRPSPSIGDAMAVNA